MKELGFYLMLFGAGSIVLNMAGYEFVILSWVDSWGTDTGWIIRAAMVVLGAVFYIRGRSAEGRASTA